MKFVSQLCSEWLFSRRHLQVLLVVVDEKLLGVWERVEELPNVGEVATWDEVELAVSANRYNIFENILFELVVIYFTLCNVFFDSFNTVLRWVSKKHNI